MPRPGGGRIRVHERATNDSAPILGADIVIQDDHRVAVRATESQHLNAKTRTDYRNRIKHIYEFWEKEYPDYFEVGVKTLTQEEMNNADMYYHKNKYDILYEGLNVEMFKAFLASRKVKISGKTTCHDHLRKYKDAVLWGAGQAGVDLPSTFYSEMEKFLHSFKKETRKAKKDGLLDEQEADPIPFTLFRQLLKWAVDGSNMFLWVYTILQWNCMARSVNIGVLGIHNFSIGGDSIKIRYDSSKSDQTGEKVNDKNVYANPLDPVVCSHLALAVWFALEDSHFELSELLFQESLDQQTASSARYCAQLGALITQFWDVVKTYLRPKHANTHGIRKGVATFVSAGTTCPPPVSSIKARGEWSLGRVLDLYWHFAEPGDHYLGRCISGLDPDSDDFATLPPHFNMANPMENPKVQQAMRTLYSATLQKYGDNPEMNVVGLLLRVLPSLIYHSDFLLETIRAANAGHAFSKLSILHQPELLAELKELVTLSPIGSVTTATGIPPHISTQRQLVNVVTLCRATLEEIKQMAETVKSAVSEAYEEKAIEQGHLTGERMQMMLEEKLTRFGDNIKQYVSEKLAEIQANLPGRERGPPDEEDNSTDDNMLADGQDDYVMEGWGEEGEGEEAQGQEGPQQRIQYRLYAGAGRFWHVPLDFNFPAETPLKMAWRMWLKGLEGNETTVSFQTRRAPVRPFRHFKLNMLPKKTKLEYTLHWRPILSFLQEAPGLRIPALPLVDDDFIESSWALVFEYLKTRVTYVFANERLNPNSWVVSYWSKKISRSSILKYGTEEDIARLPPSNNHRSRPCQQRERRRTNPGDRRRIRRRIAPGGPLHAPAGVNNTVPPVGVAGATGAAVEARATAATTRRGANNRGRGGRPRLARRFVSAILPESEEERQNREEAQTAANPPAVAAVDHDGGEDQLNLEDIQMLADLVAMESATNQDV